MRAQHDLPSIISNMSHGNGVCNYENQVPLYDRRNLCWCRCDRMPRTDLDELYLVFTIPCCSPGTEQLGRWAAAILSVVFILYVLLFSYLIFCVQIRLAALSKKLVRIRIRPSRNNPGYGSYLIFTQ